MTKLFLLLVVLVIFTCIGLNNISSRIGVPTLLAFIVLGIVVGNVGFIPIQLNDRLFAKDVCSIALIFIMFYGGFGTRMEAVRPVMKESVLLSSAGVIITAGVTGVLCHFVFRWDWIPCFLLGSVVSSTDAASVFSILRAKKLGLKNNTAPMLEVESGSNDPCAYMLTAVFVTLVDGHTSAGSVAWMLTAQIIFGLGFGWAIAQLAILALRQMRFATEGFDTLFIFAVALASFTLPELVGGNGYLSAYIVGMLLGNEDFSGKKGLVGFFDGLTGLMQVLIFFLLGLLARPSQLHRAILPALAIFLFLLLIARPAAVLSVLLPFRKYPLRQQALVSFVGLRGAASIVFAIMAITETLTLNLEFDLFNIVFCLVLLSISIQGSLIPWVARKLDMLDKNADVMKTFNDYSEGGNIHFGQIEIGEGDPWEGKEIRELGMPGNLLIVLVERGNENIRPTGTTRLQAGDRVITLSHTVEGTPVSLFEKKIKPGSRRIGHAIKEFPGTGLVVMVRRGKENIIPQGETILQEGDTLVILNL